ncbi:phosphotransferase [Streptomyces iconiensis]|uniref:Aminoglycoside phosphotransferase family protein n=1 Tax=Streptomyces iconiensis TaxID=1384038 RepID=A0ABT6ZTC3_9ACTN|nr:aminoglycoside phosphotransferase family protein [Streptomyces iconiensis]MDJ1132317.1 aminoglycoside phosphotransferase family protein [Streptomyces iconiensis]
MTVEEGGVGTLADRPDGTVVRVGHLVAKAHAPDADTSALATRIALAAHPAHAGILLPPASPPASPPDVRSEFPSPPMPYGPPPATAPSRLPLTALPYGRPASVWPYGTPVDPARPEAAPWEAAGALLARLHTAPRPQLPTPVPLMRGPAKAARALARMRRAGAAGVPVAHTSAAAAVERAWASLPAWCRDEAPPPRATALCHGDFHLGQLVRHPAPDGPWHLIDVDDLGLGDPAWDLARPASWYATGLLPPSDWERFLGAYARTREAAETREFGDPWPDLEAPAAALTAQTAALAIAKARTAARALDEAEEACVDACARIAALNARSELPAPQGP